MEIDLQHWEYEFPSELLTRYGSRHFSTQEAGKALLPMLLHGASKVGQRRVTFLERHILCANEAFPEAAVADPMADLRVWDEWCNGSRRFPYPGRFSRLGLTHQEPKTSSPSSVGVLGEIVAGLFSQAFVGPQVMVRCIRHWPDLIFHASGDIFAFVEAKAFTNASLAAKLGERIPEVLVREMLVDAVQQLNADPHIDVWGAFTGIVQIQPKLVASATMIRLTPPPQRRRANPRTELPPPVVKGVAERAVAQAALKLSPDELQAFGQPAKNGEVRGLLPLLKREEVTRREAEAILHETAMREVESVLTEAAPKEAVEGSHRLIDGAVREIIEDYRPSENLIGRRFFEIKAKAEACVLEKVRKAGEEWILMADLGPAELHRIESTWSPAWENAPTPLSQCEGQPVWRCGGAAYCCGPEALEYQRVRVR